MKVYNLQCESSHLFEGWFQSEDDFLQQQNKHLLTCPLCNSMNVLRMPSAPRLNLLSEQTPTTLVRTNSASTNIETKAQAVHAKPEMIKNMQAVQAGLLKLAREIVAKTEDVGEKFSEEVRAMHYGQAEPRNIRGSATQDERRELAEEGIEVLALPALPNLLNETLQ